MLHFGGATLDSEKFHSHLSIVSKNLSKALKMIKPGTSVNKEKRLARALVLAREKVNEEHSYALARKVEHLHIFLVLFCCGAVGYHAF